MREALCAIVCAHVKPSAPAAELSPSLDQATEVARRLVRSDGRARSRVYATLPDVADSAAPGWFCISCWLRV